MNIKDTGNEPLKVENVGAGELGAFAQQPIYTVNKAKGCAVTWIPQLLNPKVVPPPLGVEILFVQRGRRLVKGQLFNGEFCAAWMALPRLPDWVADNIAEYEAKQSGQKVGDKGVERAPVPEKCDQCSRKHSRETTPGGKVKSACSAVRTQTPVPWLPDPDGRCAPPDWCPKRR